MFGIFFGVLVFPQIVECCSINYQGRLRHPVASGVKCRPHGGMNNKMESWIVSWLSLKTKVKPGLRGSRVMSGDWWRLHRVRGVSGGSRQVSPEGTGLTSGSHRSDRCRSVRLEFCVPLRSRVCEVESWFLGPVALQ
jgi:hypothetical protein